MMLQYLYDLIIYPKSVKDNIVTCPPSEPTFNFIVSLQPHNTLKPSPEKTTE